MRVDAARLLTQRLGFLRCAKASVECKDEVVYRVSDAGNATTARRFVAWIRWKADPNAMER